MNRAQVVAKAREMHALTREWQRLFKAREGTRHLSAIVAKAGQLKFRLRREHWMDIARSLPAEGSYV